MRKFIFKITSFVLSLSILLSTVTIPIVKHYCCGSLVDVSLFPHTHSIAKEVSTANDIFKITSSKCCKQELSHIQGQTDIEYQKRVENIIGKIFSMPDSFFEDFNIQIVKSRELNYNYNPPDLELDFQVFYEVFII